MKGYTNSAIHTNSTARKRKKKIRKKGERRAPLKVRWKRYTVAHASSKPFASLKAPKGKKGKGKEGAGRKGLKAKRNFSDRDEKVAHTHTDTPQKHTYTLFYSHTHENDFVNRNWVETEDVVAGAP